MANSEPVVIASDQSALPISATNLDIRDLTASDVVTVTGGVGQTADVKVTLDGESVPVTGAFYQATQPVSGTVTASAQPGVDIGDVTVNNGAGANAVNIQDGGNSITVDGTVAISGSVPVTGTFYQATQPVSIATAVPVTDNAGSLTVDAPVGTPVFVRLSDGAAPITTLPVSLASVPSHAVTATDLDIRNLAKAQDEVYSVLKTDAGVAYDARLVTAQANSGVDIGDVTINNSTGAAAVNIQDGGNSITVDGSVTATLAAETTKVIGTVNVSTGQTITDVPATTGGLSKFHLVGAATTNATNVKASAGQVYAITAFNIAATPAYLKFHNTSGTPTAGSGVTDTFLIPGNTSGAGVVINIDKGISFATGIGITLVTGIADANTTAIAADNVVVNIYYK